MIIVHLQDVEDFNASIDLALSEFSPELTKANLIIYVYVESQHPIKIPVKTKKKFEELWTNDKLFH